MRKTAGILTLVIGVIGLIWWGSVDHARDIEETVTTAASEIQTNSIHDVDVTVSGRDITLTGVAENAEERDALVAVLREAEGRRVVRDDLMVLEAGDPYTLTAERAEGATAARGMIPSEAARAELGAIASDLELYSNAPENWTAATASGVSVLDMLRSGTLSMSGTDVTLEGIAQTEAIRDEVLAAFTGLPANYTGTANIELPPEIDLVRWSTVGDTEYTAKGLDAGVITPRLGGAKIAIGDFDAFVDGSEATFGDVDAQLGALGPWRSVIDSFTMTSRKLMIALEPGVNKDLVAQNLDTALAGYPYELVDATAADGDTRVNGLTGQTEVFRFGNWLPVLDFDPTELACRAQTFNAQKEGKVNFVTGTATLDARALRAINRLAAIVNRCLEADGLSVELAGHTDDTGEADANLALSQARADAVLAALVARGVDAERATAVGYGQTQPIRNNDTEEGRAANRRTELVWKSE